MFRELSARHRILNHRATTSLFPLLLAHNLFPSLPLPPSTFFTSLFPAPSPSLLSSLLPFVSAQPPRSILLPFLRDETDSNFKKLHEFLAWISPFVIREVAAGRKLIMNGISRTADVLTICPSLSIVQIVSFTLITCGNKSLILYDRET